MTSPLIAYLREEIRRYQDRCGVPTRDDLRARGVTRSELYAYLRGAGWHPDGDQRDAQGPAVQWSSGPPEWYHPTFLGHVTIIQDNLTIAQLADREGRSAWAILDEVAAYAPAREIWRDGQVIAVDHGTSLVSVSDLGLS